MLSLCQKALTNTRSKLGAAKKDVRTLSAALLPKKRQGIMNKTEPLKEDIGHVAKKFAMLYCLWVIDGLFPVKNVNNPDVDLWSPACWDSNEAKCNAVLTKLFMIMPQSLHKEMLKYKSFSSAVCDLSHFNCPPCANCIKLLVHFRAESGEIQHASCYQGSVAFGLHYPKGPRCHHFHLVCP